MDAATLNRDCDCVRPVPGWAAMGLPAEGPASPPALGLSAPHLFADVPLFADAADLDAIRVFVREIDQEAGLTRERGALMGYDFHLTPQGPRLIEINTNAGGALLAVRTLDAVTPGDATAVFEAKVAEMFQAEWEAAGRPGGQLRAAAIVDHDPPRQFLFPEFLLYSEIFARVGIEPVICAPADLVFDGTGLWARGRRVELVYNRWTDFALATPEAAPLRAAWEAGAIALTPNPVVHAALSDKRRLISLSERSPLVPRTVLVSADNAAELWAERKRWFFKPASGFGSRGAYRGEKLTTSKWSEILADSSPWIAQVFVPPPERWFRRGDQHIHLRFDVRAIAYAGEVQLFFARLYQGQTTNLRTPGGGFAAILSVPPGCCSTADVTCP